MRVKLSMGLLVSVLSPGCGEDSSPAATKDEGIASRDTPSDMAHHLEGCTEVSRAPAQDAPVGLELEPSKLGSAQGQRTTAFNWSTGSEGTITLVISATKEAEWVSYEPSNTAAHVACPSQLEQEVAIAISSSSPNLSLSSDGLLLLQAGGEPWMVGELPLDSLRSLGLIDASVNRVSIYANPDSIRMTAQSAMTGADWAGSSEQDIGTSIP